MNIQRSVVVRKEVGQTPLMALKKWQTEHPAYAGIPIAYAGRLDPMASGVLLLLLGEECKRQSAYLGLDKEYEVEVLLDVASDTGDVLGLTTQVGEISRPSPHEISRALEAQVGAHMGEYPAFSSKTVKGKPLFMYALEGTLDTITIPTHKECIYGIREISRRVISSDELQKRITTLLAAVPLTDEPSKRLGEDFRIERVEAGWQALFNTARTREFVVLKLRVTCASGAYMRSLAPRIGKALGTNALALSIHRTKIGNYLHLWRNLGLWYATYTL